jgi:hypothetical protein
MRCLGDRQKLEPWHRLSARERDDQANFMPSSFVLPHLSGDLAADGEGLAKQSCYCCVFAPSAGEFLEPLPAVLCPGAYSRRLLVRMRLGALPIKAQTVPTFDGRRAELASARKEDKFRRAFSHLLARQRECHQLPG